jgi:hypothetical protein
MGCELGARAVERRPTADPPHHMTQPGLQLGSGNQLKGSAYDLESVIGSASAIASVSANSSTRGVAGVAAGDRPVTVEVGRRVAMTAETELMETGFGPDPDGHAAAAVTTDAGIGAAAIGEVVMTLDAVHRAMFVVRKGERQRLAARHEGLAQGERSARV